MKMESSMNSFNNALKSRVFRRVGFTLIAFAVAGAFIFALVRFGPVDMPNLPSLDEISGTLGNIGGNKDTPVAPATPPPVKPASDDPNHLKPVINDERYCSMDVDAHDAQILAKAKAKYANLWEDKFTIAIQTYKRPEELNRTIEALVHDPVPSLYEIVVIWNDLEEKPPADLERNGVPIRYKVSARNSLNSRLEPHESYKTQAILLSDDDVYYKPADLEFVFQAWRELGHDRLVGALARCSTVDPKDKSWKYGFCGRRIGEDNYSMVLTNLAFSHIAYMDFYSSDHPIMNKLRSYVDENFNCEDVAMNYVLSHLTRQGPLEVNGNDRYVNYEPKEGISRKPGHLGARSKCLNDFADFFGCMPLMNSTIHAQRGVVPL